jgi:ABC-type Fe3+-siderophore transport system permease subunit
MIQEQTKSRTTMETNEQYDDLIIRELGRQAQWRVQMQAWEQQRRQQRRIRLAPVISNILSVAALMIVGFFLQAMIPHTKLADKTPVGSLTPVIEQLTESDSTHTTCTATQE